MVGGSTNQIGEWLSLIQWAIALTLLFFLIWYYWRFVVCFIRFATTYVGLTAIMVVLYLMVYGLIGSDLGIPYLFWHDDFVARAFSSAGATILLAVVGVIAYYLDPYPWATDRKIRKFLQADELIKHRIESGYRRLLHMAAAPAGEPGQTEIKLRRRDYLTFGMNTLIDPIAITPIQLLLEPRQENTRMLQRFLRAARAPFLLMLLAPAVLPAVFTEVPRAAPTGQLGLEGPSKLKGPPTYDVSRHFDGYKIGLRAWLVGIVAGVLIIKVLIRLSSMLHSTQVPDKVGKLLMRVRDGLRRSRQAAWLLGIQAGALVIKAFIRLSSVLRATQVSDKVGRLLTGVRDDLLRSRQTPGVPGVDGRTGEVCDAGVPGDQESRAEPHRDCPHAEANACPGSGCPRGEPTGGLSSPVDCVALGQRRVAFFVFSLLFVMTYLLLGHIRYLREIEVHHRYPLLGLLLFDLPPAFAICVALAVLAMVYAMVAYLPRLWQIPVVLGMVAWLGYANNNPYKYRFEKISYNDCDLVKLREEVAEVYGPPELSKLHPARLVSDIDALNAWKTNSADGGPDLDGKGRPKLVLVAVSGGATRSAYWTAVVLNQLERTLDKSFGCRVRIICGASGGMLGAACYVTYRRAVAEGKSKPRDGARNPKSGLEPASLLPAWIREDLPMRSMDPLAHGISLTEFWNCVLPGTTRGDRGVILERDWGIIRYPFVELSALEAQGKIPSMIFSPMLVEDGRRLLISNLELSHDDKGWSSSQIVEAACQQINQDESEKRADEPEQPAVHRRLSLSSLEYFRIFHEECHRGLYLSTAVRMSASFPFVSPAVNLPTNPPRRVVDAGYYDNYGIQVATSWIRRNNEWLARNTSGVLLVQIRDSSSVRDRLDVDDAKPGFLGWAAQGFQFLTSPVDAVARARNSTASFRNDSDVAALDSSGWNFGPDDKPDQPLSFFTSVIFENSAEVSLDPGNFWDELTKLDKDLTTRRDFREVSMSWYLARAEMAATAAAIPGDPPAQRPNEPDWTDAKERRRMIDKLNGQVYGRQGFPPGPDRALRLKRLDQLYNYERLINLKTWWNRKSR